MYSERLRLLLLLHSFEEKKNKSPYLLSHEFLKLLLFSYHPVLFSYNNNLFVLIKKSITHIFY